MNNDPLSSYVDKTDGGGSVWLKFSPDTPVKLRVLTNDPLVTIDKFGNTRFNFLVWNWDEKKAQILSKGASILKQLQAIHTDPDYGSIREVDVKITATGEGMETRYTVMPLPKSQTLTQSIIEECKLVKFSEIIKNGLPLSKYNEGEEPTPQAEEVDSDSQSGYAKARAQADNIKAKVDEVFEPSEEQLGEEEQIDLDSIPF